MGLVGGIVLLAVLLLSYLAGRMARFHGLKQGIAAWVWAVAVAAVVAIVGALLGSEFDVMSRLNGLPRLPVNEGTLTTVA